MARLDPVSGLLIADARTVDPDTLAANDGGTFGSDYTETQPRPGIAVPSDVFERLAPQVSHAQQDDLNFQVISAGMPSRDRGVELAYKADGASADTWRGWCTPNYLNGWAPPIWTDSEDYDSYDAVTIPSTGAVVLVASSGSTSACRLFDPSDWTWANGGSTTADAVTALVVLPGSERVLLLLGEDVYFSDDAGVTWTLYAESVYTGFVFLPGLLDSARVEYLNGDLLLIAPSSATDWEVFGSGDLGATFDFVEQITIGGNPAIVRALDKLVIAYVDQADDDIKCRILGSAFDKISDQDAIVIVSGLAFDEVAMAADPDGTLWVYARATASPNTVDVYLSLDQGQTWDVARDSLYDTGSTLDYLENMKAISSAGWVMLLANWTADVGNEDGSIAGLICGGWQNVTNSRTDRRLVHRYGFGTQAGAVSDRGSWIPIELPSDTTSWTFNGAGTQALQSPGEVLISTVAQQGYNSKTVGTITEFLILCELRLDAGGILTDRRVGIDLHLADGTNDHRVEVRFESTGFRVYDTNAAADVGTVTLSMGSNLQMLIYMAVGSGKHDVTTYHRRPSQTTWTIGPASTTLTNDTGSPAANGTLQWGHITSLGTNASAWTMFHFAESATVNQAIGTRLFGKPLTVTPVPIPDLNSGSGGDLVHLSVRSGPGRMRAGWTTEARHDFPLSALNPTVSPSPQTTWRSLATSNQIITWDFGANTWLGGSIGLYIANANFRTAALEYSDGPISGWTTAATLDLATDHTLRGYALDGDTLHPSGASTGGRFIYENEYTGAYVVLDPAGTPKPRRVRSNSAGLFDAATASARCTFILQDVDGTEAATGSVDLVSHTGVLIWHPTSEQRQRYWRVNIAAGQDIVDTYYRAGLIVPMRLAPFGAEPAWGPGSQVDTLTQASRSRSGTTRVVELGKPTESWSLAWPEGASQFQIRQGADPDYLAVSGGNYLATREDVSQLLRGFTELTKSGEIPCVALEDIPTTTTTITDRTRFLYGRLTGSIRTEVTTGQYGSTEVVRVESVTVEGIP